MCVDNMNWRILFSYIHDIALIYHSLHMADKSLWSDVGREGIFYSLFIQSPVYLIEIKNEILRYYALQ